MNCLTDDELWRYAMEQASEPERLQADAHLADCEPCVDRLHRRLEFRELLDTWTASSHGRVLRACRLRAAAADKPEATSILKACWDALCEGIDSLRIMLDPRRKLACATVGVCSSDRFFRLCVPDSGVGAADELSQVPAKLRQSSELLSQGKRDEATQVLQAVQSVNAWACSGSVGELRSRTDRPYLEVAADAIRRAILVKCWPQPERRGRYLAALFREDSAEPPILKELEAVQGEEYLLAEFEEVSDEAAFWEAAVVVVPE